MPMTVRLGQVVNSCSAPRVHPFAGVVLMSRARPTSAMCRVAVPYDSTRPLPVIRSAGRSLRRRPVSKHSSPRPTAPRREPFSKPVVRGFAVLVDLRCKPCVRSSISRTGAADPSASFTAPSWSPRSGRSIRRAAISASTRRKTNHPRCAGTGPNLRDALLIDCAERGRREREVDRLDPPAVPSTARRRPSAVD
jgi:hypothetical protein